MIKKPSYKNMYSNPVGLVAAVLVILGIALSMFASKGFIILTGLGIFGPGILREFGLLNDQDEFQRHAAHRAGYHAYLAGGLVAVIIVSVFEWTGFKVNQPVEWMNLILVVMWVSWMFSSLLEFWGARKTASRLLMVFGSFWTVFIIASFMGESDPDTSLKETILGLLFGTSLIAAFFVPAWTALRWPKPTGALLLLVVIALLVILGGKGGLDWSTVLLTQAMLTLPLAISGIALLRDIPGRQ